MQQFAPVWACAPPKVRRAVHLHRYLKSPRPPRPGCSLAACAPPLARRQPNLTERDGHVALQLRYGTPFSSLLAERDLVVGTAAAWAAVDVRPLTAITRHHESLRLADRIHHRRLSSKAVPMAANTPLDYTNCNSLGRCNTCGCNCLIISFDIKIIGQYISCDSLINIHIVVVIPCIGPVFPIFICSF